MQRYVDIRTNEIGTYDDFWRVDENGERVNAVDLKEVYKLVPLVESDFENEEIKP